MTLLYVTNSPLHIGGMWAVSILRRLHGAISIERECYVFLYLLQNSVDCCVCKWHKDQRISEKRITFTVLLGIKKNARTQCKMLSLFEMIFTLDTKKNLYFVTICYRSSRLYHTYSFLPIDCYSFVCYKNYQTKKIFSLITTINETHFFFF